jgi:ATP-binding cassette subfamily B multidrug efflux pump
MENKKTYYNNIKAEEKDLKFSHKSALRLYSYALPYIGQFIIVFILIAVSTLATLYQPRIIRTLIDGPFPVLIDGKAGTAEVDQAMAQAVRWSFIYLGTVAVTFISAYFQIMVLQKTGQKILMKIRQDLYEHVLRLPTAFFDHYPLGSLVTRVTNDTETLNEMFTSVLSSVLRNTFALIGIIIMMYQMDVRLATYTMALLPIVVIISVVFRKAIRKVYTAQRRILSIINTKLSENISGMRTIQVFNRQDQIHEEFNEVNDQYLHEGRREVLYFAIYRPAIEVVQGLGIAALIWFGGKGFLAGVISFGTLYAFFDYITRLFQPILQLAETYNLIQSAMTSTERIFHLMDVEEENQGGTVKVGPEGLKGHIEFKNVWFAYNEGEWILKDVSFEVKPGEFVAFVGATGAGKSTIMHLLCRFYDIDKGEILIDGVPIQDYCLADLRRSIGVVQQNIFLYSGSIVDNITLNRESVSHEDARRAAKLVNAEEFIYKLPHGFDEEITERGSTLSSGQRQLLSFARTVAAKPSLLVLDEATANIDTETEILIQEAIGKMAQGRSMIAVAHRISTIADADRIIVMHNGQVAEQGNKEELLAQDGIFKVLYQLQYQEG